MSRYILHLSEQKTIKAKIIQEVTQRTGLGLKHQAVLYEDEKGEICCRRKDEFERMFQPEKT